MTADLTVFLIDDDDGALTSLDVLMCANGWRTNCFASGEAFLESFSDDQQGIIVSDFRLSGISGLEVLRRLNAGANVLPFILISGYADDKMTQEALALGAFAVLEKPLAPGKLADSVNEAADSLTSKYAGATAIDLEPHQIP